MNIEKISLIGLGKLGLPLLCTFANSGQKILGIDIDREKIDNLRKKILPFYEPQLREYLNSGFKNIQVVSNCNDVIEDTDVAIILVNTPSREDGEFSNEYIYDAVGALAQSLKFSTKEDFLFVISSTVMPQSHKTIIKKIEDISGRKLNNGFGVTYVPDLVALGTVIKDFENPDVLIIGESEKKYGDIAESLYKKIIKNNAPVVRMSLVEGEMTKVSLNAYVTMKISFANFIGNITDKLKCNHSNITKALGYDKRISPHFIKSGLAFGGTCFPRDTWAFIKLSENLGLDALHIKATQRINELQNELLFEKVKGYKDKTIGIIGLSFKPDTIVVDESPGQILFDKLNSNSYNVRAFDSLVLNSTDLQDFINNIDVVVITHNDKKLISGVRFDNKIIVDNWGVLRSV